MKLAARLWGDRYQVIVATHLDKENHLHNHFVLNTVSFADGIKYHRTKKDYHEMQTVSDELCREYGLSVIEHPQHGQSQAIRRMARRAGTAPHLAGANTRRY
ncbi:MAG: relaxase/mobilization nuclease domain-containing protein [Oscillospiraceae bacterium]